MHLDRVGFESEPKRITWAPNDCSRITSYNVCYTKLLRAQALARKPWMRPLADDEIPEIHALGRQIVEQLPPDQRPVGGPPGSSLSVPLTDPAERG